MLWASHVTNVERQTGGQTDRLAHVCEDLINLRCPLGCNISFVLVKIIKLKSRSLKVKTQLYFITHTHIYIYIHKLPLGYISYH